METKELKIEIPQGYEIDYQKSTFEKIIFKKNPREPKNLGRLLFINERKNYTLS